MPTERCKACGVIPQYHVEYDTCSYCGGTCRDDIGNTCIFCERGERAIEEWICACDPNGDDEQDTAPRQRGGLWACHPLPGPLFGRSR